VSDTIIILRHFDFDLCKESYALAEKLCGCSSTEVRERLFLKVTAYMAGYMPHGCCCVLGSLHGLVHVSWLLLCSR